MERFQRNLKALKRGLRLPFLYRMKARGGKIVRVTNLEFLE